MVEVVSEDVLEWARDLQAIQRMFADVQPPTIYEPGVILQFPTEPTRQDARLVSSAPQPVPPSDAEMSERPPSSRSVNAGPKLSHRYRGSPVEN